MGHEIRLEKQNLRTDLIIENLENRKESYTKESKESISITDIVLDEKQSKEIGKKKGRYITIEFEDITDYENRKKVTSVFAKELKKILTYNHIKDHFSALIVGLGNDKSTPDALGPLTIDNTLVTRHLIEIGQAEEGFRCVSVLSPGVMGTTGIETSELIFGAINHVKPDFLLVIDALASQSITRVNKTIQITDTGIHPGSGIGNKRKEISKETMQIPVIAIGVPTVVDAVTIVSDTIHYMYKHYAYMKKNMHNPMNKLMVGNINYLKKNVEIEKEDKQNLFGMLGSLNEMETKVLINEVLSPIGYNLMVTPKEVDFVMEKLALVLSEGINMALHKKVTHL